MRTMTKILGLTIAGALVTVGSMAAPVQAAPARPVTSGNAQFVINPMPGVPDGWFTALAPARATPDGLFFPVANVNDDTVTLRGQMALVTGGGTQTFTAALHLNQASKGVEVVLAEPTAGTTASVFFSTHMKRVAKVTVNLKKRTRTTSTVWSGELHLHSGSASDLAFAQTLNTLYNTTFFAPNVKLGTIALTINSTLPCKNAACTK